MSDFFGSILDSIRSTGDDVNSFFGTNITNGIGRGIAAGNGYGLRAEAYDNANNQGITPAQFVTKRNAGLLETADRLSSLNNFGRGDIERSHHPTEPGYGQTQQKTRPAQAEDFNTVEQTWMRRMLRFAELDNVTGPKINEKGP